MWCVRADDAEAATAWTPATGRSEGVTVAVLTGRDPRRSAAVRDAIVEGLRDGSLAAPHRRTRTPGVALVGGGPGDPDLITVRGRRLLAEADVVIADRLGPRDLLAELPPHVEVIDAAKIPYGRFMAQEAINNALIEHAKAGKAVVRLKGGDPFVFGRGMEEAQALAEAGIPCTVVPGISSTISVPGAAGIPVTHRGVAHEFTVVSGHVAPDDERSLVDWPALARLRGTLVVLMGVENSGAIAAKLIEHGRAADTPAAVVQEGTTAAQRRVDATLATLGETVRAEGVRPPAVIVIGDVVGVRAPSPECRSHRQPMPYAALRTSTPTRHYLPVAEIITVDDPDDPRLRDYTGLTDVELRRRREPAEGLFIAEGEKVIRRAGHAGYAMRSMLLSAKWVDVMRDVIDEVPAPVYAVSPDLAERVTGYHVHRGALASMQRKTAARGHGTSRHGAPDRGDGGGQRPHQHRGDLPQRRGPRHGRGAALPGLRRPALPPLGEGLHGRGVLRAVRPPGELAPGPGGGTGGGFQAARADPGGAGDRDGRGRPAHTGARCPDARRGGRRADHRSALRAADEWVRIPMAHGVDSLNVGAAAAVAFYAVATGRPGVLTGRREAPPGHRTARAPCGQLPVRPATERSLSPPPGA